MDALPPPPPAHEQLIAQNLVACGLSAAGVAVIYQADWQGYEIVIGPEAKASPEHFACIEAASDHEFMTFVEPLIDEQYSAYVAGKYRPEMLAKAWQELSRRGRLDGFPSRALFGSDILFAEAVEEHCGVPKGSALHAFGDRIAFQPPPEDLKDFTTLQEKYGCLFAAIQLITLQGDLRVGFIGNDARKGSD